MRTMWKMYLSLPVMLLALLAFHSPVLAQSAAPTEPFSGDVLCLPDAYLQAAPGCLPLGPSVTLTELAKQGISYPPRPLPGAKPPAALTVSPVQIAKINLDDSQPAPIFATLDDAVAGSNPVRSVAPAKTRYVSYIETAEVNGNTYVMLRGGLWMRASPAGYPLFQGLLFRQTPVTMFGWMLDSIAPYTAPGFANPQRGDVLPKWTVIQISEEQKADGMEWYRIGPEQWVPHQKARRVNVNTTPPQGVTNNRWIEVNLYDQTLSVYQDRQLVFATLIASGAEPLYTRPGLFQIFEKHDIFTMTGANEADSNEYYYLEDVPWTMFFDQGRALHGAYWRSWFGFVGTHGCVNLSIGDSAWLYQWASVGDWVYVWDPSGETPTDPSLYGAGGA